MTILRHLGNSGTVIVNGGIFQNIDGYVHNIGTIIHEKGTFANRGSIVSGLGDDSMGGYLMQQVNVGSNFVNRATLQNSGYITSQGRFPNYGNIQNEGKIEFIGGIVLNNGTILNDRRFEIASEFTNNGTMENSGMLVVYRRLMVPPPEREYHIPVFNNYGDLTTQLAQFAIAVRFRISERFQMKWATLLIFLKTVRGSLKIGEQ